MCIRDRPAQGITVLTEDSQRTADMKTSRDLVADVVTEVATRETLPSSPLEFIDGDGSVKDI